MAYLNPRYADKKNTFGPRIGFNHGYHDATHERELGRPRRLASTGHSTAIVAMDFDVMYFEGYKMGLLADLSSGRPETSEPAWVAFRGTLTPAQLDEIFAAEVSSELAGVAKEYIKYERPHAMKRAAEICGR